MKRFFSIMLLSLVASTWFASQGMGDELPMPKTIQSNLSVQTQQSSTQDAEGTRRLIQVSIEGSGSVDKLQEVRASIQKQLSTSGLSDETQSQALESIMRKLDEETQDAADWAGSIVWTSTVPGETQVSFSSKVSASAMPEDASVPELSIGEPLLEQETRESVAESKRDEIRPFLDPRTGTLLEGLAERLQQPAARLRENATRMADRARALQQERMNAQQQAIASSQTRYRIGIDCQSAPGENDPSPERGLREKGTGQNDSNPTANVFEVFSVMADSPAAQVGLQIGDRVASINGEKMGSVEQLIEAVQVAGKENKKLVLEIVRKGEHIEFQIQPVVMAELTLDSMRQSFPFPGNLPGVGVIDGWLGVLPNQVGPGWVMNRQELNEFRRNPANGPGNEAAASPALAEQISELQKEIAELKSMVNSLMNK